MIPCNKQGTDALTLIRICIYEFMNRCPLAIFEARFGRYLWDGNITWGGMGESGGCPQGGRSRFGRYLWDGNITWGGMGESRGDLARKGVGVTRGELATNILRIGCSERDRVLPSRT